LRKQLQPRTPGVKGNEELRAAGHGALIVARATQDCTIECLRLATRLKTWISRDACIRWISRHRSTTLLGTELVNYGTHGISQPDGVVFAAGGTIVNFLVIYCFLTLRALFKRKL
jgi:hypothetical protein